MLTSMQQRSQSLIYENKLNSTKRRMYITQTTADYLTTFLPNMQLLHNASRVKEIHTKGDCTGLIQLGWKRQATVFLYWNKSEAGSAQKESYKGLRNCVRYQLASLDDGGNIFEWITILNQRIGSSRRKVLLSVDNCSAQGLFERLLQLENVEITYLL